MQMTHDLSHPIGFQQAFKIMQQHSKPAPKPEKQSTERDQALKEREQGKGPVCIPDLKGRD
jgi:hypothetical protein